MNGKIYKLGEILTESKIISEKPDSNNRITVKLNVKGVEKRPDKNDVKGATKYFIRSKGQFIYGKQNLHKGAFGIIPKDLDGYETTSDIPTFDINTNICLPDMLMYFFKQNDYYKSLEGLAKGVGSKRIHPAQIFDLEIYLPSIETQEEILSKSLLKESKVQDLSKIINKNLTYIKQLKQSILQEAIEGKLTKSWREKNPNTESASILLKKIKKEKEELVRQKKLKKQEKLKEITSDEIPFEIPESWSWCRLGEVCNYGITQQVDPNKIGENTWILELEDIEKTTSKLLVKNYSDNKSVYSTKNIFYKGYILYSKLRPYLDKVLIADENGVCTSEIIPFFTYINAYYQRLFMKSNFFLDYSEEKVLGMRMPRFGKEDVRNCIFPLPPLEEQNEITKKVNEMMKLCNELEKQSLETKENSENLMKSVLSEVFR